MLRLIGEKADGWLPSLSYLQPGDLERGQGIIDEAATSAGRDPRQIRRLLNVNGSFPSNDQGFLQGPPAQWVEQLLPLVLQHGVGTFILWADDPRSIEIWGREVAPALREAVARERRTAGTSSGEVVRSPKALALRHKGIDYAAVPRSLEVVEPGDRTYARVRSNFWYAGAPGLVLRPGGVDEVVAALGYARSQEVSLSIRSGGHGVTGNSTNDGGIVIDLDRLDAVEVLDPDAGRIRVGPGARWRTVAEALTPFGLAISSGDYGGVGVGGLATAGGVGFLARKHGLTIDHIVAAEVVLADGTVVRADADHHPDLFWALRGAGGNVGIVTSFELAAKPTGDVVFARLVYDAGDLPRLLERWGEAVENAPRELTSFLYAAREPAGVRYAQIAAVYTGPDDDAAVEALIPLLHAAPVVGQHAQRLPYAALIHTDEMPYYGGSITRPLVSNGFAAHLTAELSGEIAGALRAGVSRWLSIRAVGGAVNDVAPLATAFPHRDQNFNVSDIGSRGGDYLRYWDRLREHTTGLYTS